MTERAPGRLVQRVMRALAGQAEEARRAAIERTSAKYPDAYPPGAAEREQQREREEPDER